VGCSRAPLPRAAELRFEGRPASAATPAEPATIRERQSIAFIGSPIGGGLGYAPVTRRRPVS
jgi:hypothetical protein